MQPHTIRAAGFTATVDAFALERTARFISMLGSQQSVRAHWARFVKGETAYLSESDLGAGASECWLAREAWGTWRFHGAGLPASAAYHGILVPDLAGYTCKRQDFVPISGDKRCRPADRAGLSSHNGLLLLTMDEQAPNQASA